MKRLMIWAKMSFISIRNKLLKLLAGNDTIIINADLHGEVQINIDGGYIENMKLDERALPTCVIFCKKGIVNCHTMEVIGSPYPVFWLERWSRMDQEGDEE